MPRSRVRFTDPMASPVTLAIVPEARSTARMGSPLGQATPPAGPSTARMASALTQGANREAHSTDPTVSPHGVEETPAPRSLLPQLRRPLRDAAVDRAYGTTKTKKHPLWIPNSAPIHLLFLVMMENPYSFQMRESTGAGCTVVNASESVFS